MADEGANAGEVFRRSTMNRIASADELDHYIKVTNPSAWVVTIAALLLIAGVIIWAVVAIVPVTVETTGIYYRDSSSGENVVLCWVDKSTAQKIEDSGAKASIDGVVAKRVELNDVPMSASEVINYLGSDFYADSLDLSDWNYLVSIEPGEDPKHSDYTIDTFQGKAHLVPVSIVVSETRPINIVLGKK